MQWLLTFGRQFLSNIHKAKLFLLGDSRLVSRLYDIFNINVNMSSLIRRAETGRVRVNDIDKFRVIFCQRIRFFAGFIEQWFCWIQPCYTVD